MVKNINLAEKFIIFHFTSRDIQCTGLNAIGINQA